MTVSLALDTAVMIAAVLGEPDRLWKDWRDFDKREAAPRFLPRSAPDEYSQVVDGLGRAEPGVLETVVADGARLIRAAGRNPPDKALVESLRLPLNRTARLQKLVPVLRAIAPTGWSARAALFALRAFEREVYVRKRDFRSRHPLFAASDAGTCEKKRAKLFAMIPSGGISWGFDARILAEASQHFAETGLKTEFVTDDRKHMRSRNDAILAVTGLERLRDLQGRPLSI